MLLKYNRTTYLTKDKVKIWSNQNSNDTVIQLKNRITIIL